MRLLDRAAADFARIVGDSARGFGTAVTVTSPEGVVFETAGLQHDISELIDPSTGTLVQGREARLSVALKPFSDAGKRPVGVADSSRRPWVVEFSDVRNVSHTFKVQRAQPDHTIGALVLSLEFYKK